MVSAKTKVLFVDNFDSFTYNLVDEFGKRNCITRVYRADTSLDELIEAAGEFGPDLLVLSPGPCRASPSRARLLLRVRRFRRVLW